MFKLIFLFEFKHREIFYFDDLLQFILLFEDRYLPNF